MKKLIDFRSMLMIGASCLFVVLAAGSDEPKDKNDVPPSANETLGIPEDAVAGEAPTVENPTTTLSNAAINVGTQDGHHYLTIDMTGVWDEFASDWLALYGTSEPAQNVWVTIDDNPKGIDVYNNANENTRTLIADVVFLVDNSGSMSEEAEAVAKSIMTWSTLLSEAGLDLRVGCVGYGDSYNAVDGAFNISTPDALYDWMQSNGYGVWRTHTFGGPDAQKLSDLANTKAYDNGSYNECGMVALHFAHDNFNFRSGSNRIYVNFTDEPNQPSGIERFSVEYLNPENGNWKTNYGTVHSVYSDWKYEYNRPLWEESPWKMAEYTGGTQLFTDRYFTDFTLENLPVTGAMQNSYLIRLTNIEAYFDNAEHKITITVYSKDGKVTAVKEIWFNFSSAVE